LREILSKFPLLSTRFSPDWEKILLTLSAARRGVFHKAKAIKAGNLVYLVGSVYLVFFVAFKPNRPKELNRPKRPKERAA
jgi:hypothetical protein